MLHTIFFVCFGVGIGYALLSLVLGTLLDLGDFGDIDTGAISPLRPAPLAAFLTVFGGVGLLLYDTVVFFVALGGAAGAGIVVVYLLTKFILMPLYKAQSTSTVDQKSLIGKTVKVSEKIFENGFGKISYHINGSNISSPAKSEDGSEISVGTDVEIVNIEKNTYFVKTV